MSGIAVFLAALALRRIGTVAFGNQTLDADSTAPVLSQCTIEFNSNGNYSGTTTGDVVSGAFGPTAYVTPTTDAAYLEVRATLNSGSLFSGTTGSWLPLTSTRSWSVRGASSSQSANLTIEVRQVGSGTVLDSATMILSASSA